MDAVSFAAEGKPLSNQFLAAFSRLLTSIQERNDMVQIVVNHHMMSRLAQTFRRLASTEEFIFENSDPELSFENQLKTMDPELRVKLLALLYKEAGVLFKLQRDQRTKATPVAAPNAIEDASRPPTAAQLAAQNSARNLGTDGREKVRSFIAGLLAQQEEAITAEAEIVDEEAAETSLEGSSS